MSTVISWSRTADGFVVGSDGRNSDAEGRVISDATQKIFPIDQRGVCLAFALGATIQLGYGPGHLVFDFSAETARAVERLAVRRFRDWHRYAMALMESLRDSLGEAREASGIRLDAPTETYIFIGGFYEKRQHIGHIYFHHGTTSSYAELSLHPPGHNVPKFGSQAVFDLIDKDDPRLLQYAYPKRNDIFSLSEGIERVEKDIRAHYDPEAHQVDPGRCRGIGGRIQIATVTLGNRFKWVPGFDPTSGRE